MRKTIKNTILTLGCLALLQTSAYSQSQPQTIPLENHTDDTSMILVLNNDEISIPAHGKRTYIIDGDINAFKGQTKWFPSDDRNNALTTITCDLTGEQVITKISLTDDRECKVQ